MFCPLLHRHQQVDTVSDIPKGARVRLSYEGTYIADWGGLVGAKVRDVTHYFRPEDVQIEALPEPLRVGDTLTALTAETAPSRTIVRVGSEVAIGTAVQKYPDGIWRSPDVRLVHTWATSDFDHHRAVVLWVPRDAS